MALPRPSVPTNITSSKSQRGMALGVLRPRNPLPTTPLTLLRVVFLAFLSLTLGPCSVFVWALSNNHNNNIINHPVLSPLDPLSPSGSSATPSVSAGISARELAQRLRKCISRNRDRLPSFSFESKWAGKVIEVAGSGLIVGPLVPKVASTVRSVAQEI